MRLEMCFAGVRFQKNIVTNKQNAGGSCMFDANISSNALL